MNPADLSLLATLDALLQEASVTKAARRMGLSTPAMSHALGRIRERLGDPILVRAGRAMVLTPRAEALRPRIRSLVAEAAQALEAERPFSAGSLRRSFVVHATDHVVTVIGGELDRALAADAPHVVLRFVPNVADDAAALREGTADLAVGIYAALPPEVRTRSLFTDRFVCVVREENPLVGKRLTLKQFVELEHVQVAPRGRPGGLVDEVLRQQGLERRVKRAVPFFLAALNLVAETDYVLTISERIARKLAPKLGLRVLDAPIALDPYTLQLVWHPRFDGDAGHQYLRDVFVAAARRAAGDVHAGARTRLGRPARRRAKPATR